MLTLALLLATPLETQRTYEACLEAGADRAARAGGEREAFDAGLPELCADEEAALVRAVVVQRADRDPALTGQEPGARAETAARGYADGLRGVVAAGYPTLLQLRGPTPDPNRYPYGGTAGAGTATPGTPPLFSGGVPPLGGSPSTRGVPPLSGGVPPLGPSPTTRPVPRRISVSPDGAVRARPVRAVTTPPAATARATPPSPARDRPRPSPAPRHVRVPPG